MRIKKTKKFYDILFGQKNREKAAYITVTYINCIIYFKISAKNHWTK